VEVSVLKQANAQREVMAAPDMLLADEEVGQDKGALLLPNEDAEQDIVVDELAATPQQENAPMPRAAPQSEKEAPVREAIPELIDPSSSGSKQLTEQQSKQPLLDTTNLADNTSAKSPSSCCPGSQRRAKGSGCDWCSEVTKSTTHLKRPKGGEPGKQLEHLIQELFRAHDLNSDGLLDEQELIRLNQAVAEVHDSRDTENIQKKYSVLFREKLDPEGRPVPYATFRNYILEMLDAIDSNELAQEMIVEQFLCEARLARTVVTGEPLLVDKPHPKVFYQACLRFCPEKEAALEVRA